MNSNINENFKDLEIEDLIWLIYIFLAIAALISNYYEKTSLIFNNKQYNKNSKSINITIFIITFFVYLYFVYLNWRNIKKEYLNNQNILLSQAKLIAALLFLVGGIIYLITEIQDTDNAEIGII